MRISRSCFGDGLGLGRLISRRGRRAYHPARQKAQREYELKSAGKRFSHGRTPDSIGLRAACGFAPFGFVENGRIADDKTRDAVFNDIRTAAFRSPADKPFTIAMDGGTTMRAGEHQANLIGKSRGGAGGGFRAWHENDVNRVSERGTTSYGGWAPRSSKVHIASIEPIAMRFNRGVEQSWHLSCSRPTASLGDYPRYTVCLMAVAEAGRAKRRREVGEACRSSGQCGCMACASPRLPSSFENCSHACIRHQEPSPVARRQPS